MEREPIDTLPDNAARKRSCAHMRCLDACVTNDLCLIWRLTLADHTPITMISDQMRIPRITGFTETHFVSIP